MTEMSTPRRGLLTLAVLLCLAAATAPAAAARRARLSAD